MELGQSNCGHDLYMQVEPNVAKIVSIVEGTLTPCMATWQKQSEQIHSSYLCVLYSKLFPFNPDLDGTRLFIMAAGFPINIQKLESPAELFEDV